MEIKYAIKRILKSTKFPKKEIEYLRDQPYQDDVFETILFTLRHAYDGALLTDNTEELSSAPLWFAIIAEEDKYLKEELIDPVIHLFFVENDWDYLNEQAQFLIGKLAEKFSDLFFEKIIRTIDITIKYTPDQCYPYLFLFDAFYSADIDKYKTWLLEIAQNPKMPWQDALISDIANWQIKEAIPILKNMLKTCPKNQPFWSLENEIKSALEQLESGILTYPKYAKHSYKQRANWQEHYKDYDKNL